MTRTIGGTAQKTKKGRTAESQQKFITGSYKFNKNAPPEQTEINLGCF